MRTDCKMKSKTNADLSRISISNTFVQSDLCIVILLICEAVVVKSFLLVNFLEQSGVLTTTLIV